LCAYLCVTELPGGNDTRKIGIFAVVSNPTSGANVYVLGVYPPKS
jgi:hypothetical protein